MAYTNDGKIFGEAARAERFFKHLDGTSALPLGLGAEIAVSSRTGAT